MHDLARHDHLDLEREVHMKHLPAPVDVFIPRGANAERNIGARRGSAIVGENAASGLGEHLDIYFQDDMHGSLPAFADRALQAAGRMLHRAPTIARLSDTPVGELLYVGVYDDIDGEIHLVDDDDAREELRIWLGLHDVADLERHRHTTTSVRHDQRRGIRNAIKDTGGASPAVQRIARRLGHEDLLDPPNVPEDTK